MSSKVFLRCLHVLAVAACIFVLLRSINQIGLFIFIFIPLLFFIIPLIALQQRKVNIVFGKPVAPDWRVFFDAATQLVSAALMYIAIPGTADTTRVLLLGEFEVNESDPVAKLFYLAVLAAIIVFILSSRRLHKSLKRVA